MSVRKKIIYITSQELIKNLKISADELHDIEKHFDDIPDDEWELIPEKDYRVVIKATGLREYTESGAYCIARYLEKNKKTGFFAGLFDGIKEWFLHTKKKIRQGFIKGRILNNCSSLVKRNNQFFISRNDVIKIFETRSDYLSKIDTMARNFKLEPLTKGEDGCIPLGNEYKNS
jgi:hypothetical protein